uniref:NADH-ubiquinone oxidoreductase chain 3 n=1 Tax=Chaoborus sp. ZK-2019 TaxID=2527953 RepID=A0A411NHH9_9DIPT|nr:NADH dehydrogenase subunit 3 [Chaoborus sp. ZK-2019]
MFATLNLIMIIFIIAFIVSILASILSKKAMTDREKMTPIECGFDPISPSRLPFSLQFFLIAIIFLIFDVEIALILPLIMIIYTSNIYFWIYTGVFFIGILLMGLYHEWNQGALKWSN